MSDEDYVDVGDAAEPYRCTPADFPLVTHTIDRELWRHVVVVGGGVFYTEAEAQWVLTKFKNAMRSKIGKNQIHVFATPTQGAASILFRAYHTIKQPAMMELLDTSYGRAAPMRCAWRLLADADSLVLFEPFDEIARHLNMLAGLMQTRWGRGLPVVVVRARKIL